jgi:hypothetical protein
VLASSAHYRPESNGINRWLGASGRVIQFRLSEAAVRGAVGEPRAVVGQPAGAKADC